MFLRQSNQTVYFTKTHIADLKKVIEIDGASHSDDSIDQSPGPGSQAPRFRGLERVRRFPIRGWDSQISGMVQVLRHGDDGG